MADDVDLSDLSAADSMRALGEAAHMSLRMGRAAVLLLRDDGVVTVLNPEVLLQVPDEALVDLLVNSWPDEDIASLLARRDAERLK